MKPRHSRVPPTKAKTAANPLAVIVQKALQHHQAGQFDEAESLYRQALSIRPNYPDALHLLGFLYHYRNQNEQAVEWIEKAIVADPKQPLFFSNLGTVYSAMGQLDQAIACYQKSLAIKPDYYNALCNLGNALKDQGQVAEAIACHRKALAIEPNFYEGLNNLGITLQESGEREEAIVYYRKAIALQPNTALAYSNLGFALHEDGKIKESIANYKKALELKPAYPEAYNNLGNVFLTQGNYEEALVCYKNALAISPDYQDAHNNLGNLLRDQGKLDEALDCYQKALATDPNLYDAYNNMGITYQKAGKKQDAIDSYRKALVIKPDHYSVCSNLGFALQSVGDMEEALLLYERALAIKPNDPNAHSTVLHQQLWLCDWKAYQSRYETMIRLFHTKKEAANPFTFVLYPTTAIEQRLCAEYYVRDKYPVQKNLSANRTYAPNPERIKIGYLSCDFQDHATALLMAELFELHDHDRFEIKAYSYGQDDGKAMRRRIMAACDTFTDLYAASHEESAHCILNDGIHILVEMKGFTNHTRLEITALRPAPIQASWLGYPGTIGGTFIDYILTDPFITPPGFEAHFSEKVVRLPDCYQPNDRQRAITSQTPSRQASGLPEQGFVFASFNKSYKINPELFDVWMRLLQGTPGSILWLWESNETVIRNLRREAEARGVAGSRLYFASYQTIEDHLARYRLVDLVLDPFPCTSHTTGSDALWAGCPMVTCAGETFASRVAGSLLINVGLPELVTETPEAYESLVLSLANDPARLSVIRQRLQDNLSTSPLFDSRRYTKHLESAYEAMWQRFKEGLKPDTIDVQPLDPGDTEHLNRKPFHAGPREATVTAPRHDTATTVAEPELPPIAVELQTGLQHHQAGRLEEAETIYRHVLEQQESYAEAQHLLGFLYHQRGQQEIAAEWIGKAVASDPTQPLFLSNLGIVYCELGDRDKAIECYQKALDIQPDFYNALCNMGNVLLDKNRRKEGIVCYRKALEIHPQLHAGHNNLGNALQGDGQYEEAILSYERALALKPDYNEAYNNMGFAYQSLGKYDQAIEVCRKALAIKPDYHEAYSNIGNAYQGQGLADEALVYYRKALEINPNYRDAYNNMGNTLLGQGKVEEAVTCYRKALEIAPNLYDAHNNLGNALQEQGKVEEAISCYRRAIALKPDYFGALNNLGFALLDQGHLEEAIDCYQQALDLEPSDPNKHSAVLHQMLHICDWTNFQSRYDRMIEIFNAGQKNVIPFVFLSLPTTPLEQKKCAELYIQDRVSVQADMAATRQYAPQPKRLKIGYLSGDYQNHPVAYLMAELFDLHDRDRFEITAYSYGEDDGRDMRQRIMQTSDHFVDLRPLTYQDAAQRILDDGIHILIEMNGFTKGVRLQIPALHPAPIQVFWLGYAGTEGAPFIDYVLTDPFVTPPGFEAHFTEKVVRLPDCFMPNDRKRTVLPRIPTRKESGLPETGIIFANFNKTYKINPEMFDVWMRVLRETPGSVLWMREYNRWASANLRREAEARGVAGSRLVFAPLTPTVNEHLARYRLADLVMDNFPYTSHSTGMDTLWGGCPMVTRVGDTFASRVAGSLLTNLGLSELVTDSLETYETLVLALAKDPERLAALRQRLQDNVATSPLFDSVRFTMGMEAAFETMWQRFQTGLAPETIDTPPVDIQGNTYLRRKAAAALPTTQPTPIAPSPAPKALESALSLAQQIMAMGSIPGIQHSPLFANAISRAIQKELSVMDLIDTASKLGDTKEAHLIAELYRVWLEYNPEEPLRYAIYFNYGSVLAGSNNQAGARDAFRMAISINPDFYPPYINLGNALEKLGSVEDAIAVWQVVVDRLRTVKPDAIKYKLSALKQIGRAAPTAEASEMALRQSLEINHHQRDILHQWINVRKGQCKWPILEPWEECDKDHLMHGFAPLSLATYSDDPLLQLASATQYNKNEVGQAKVHFLDKHRLHLENRSSSHLRIGYLSSDLREHAVGYLTAEIYELHDHEKVEVFIYYTGHAVNDHINQRVRAAADHYLDIVEMSDSDVAHIMVADKIDILVDLNGHTQGARPKLLAMRPAPILVNWLGFPGTMGGPHHNYIIADDFIIPPSHEIYYSEQVVRLPCYQPNDRKRRIKAYEPSRQAEGLPENTMVYSCLNGVQKITLFSWKLWMDILRQVPESVLWLLNENEDIRNRLREIAEQHGVAAERLIFAERKPNFEHVPRFALSDLGLDTSPYGSHTTASDALWAGVPVLTLPGISFTTRVCGSLVKAAGLEEFICQTPEEYVTRAVAFGKDREKLLVYRQKLAAQRDSCILFDTPLLVRHLEKLYAQMWDDFKQGNLPRPDLTNLDIYQEIGIELDQGGFARSTDTEYRAMYLEKLRDKHRYRFIGKDNRLWL